MITLRGALQLRNDLFDENFYKHHPVFALSGSVREICQPFFKAVNINYLDDCRVYSDNSVVGLSSDSAWLEHFFRRKFMFGCTLKDEGKHLWQTHQSHELLHEASYYHKHDHGIGIFYKKDDYLEYFDLAAPLSNARQLIFCYWHDDERNR